MDDGDAILAAILADPADDTPRLVYADWLEENAGKMECGTCKGSGQRWPKLGLDKRGSGPWCHPCSGTGRVSDGRAERAEFIRVQVELARMGKPTCAALVPLQFTDWQVEYMQGMSCGRCEMCKKAIDLSRREWELLAHGRHNWQGPLIEVIPKGAVIDDIIQFSRGFVSALTCTWDAWRTHADAILKAQPIERVKLTTWPEVEWAGARRKPIGRPARLAGREWHFLEGEWRGGDDLPTTGAYTLLKREWPRIEFELPDAARPSARFAGLGYDAVVSLQDDRTELASSAAQQERLLAADEL